MDPQTFGNRLSDANAGWLKTFQSLHNRQPKVLHIGNIANNAYNNARLLNQAGLDCDVICYDYYHTMACPEWEDASFLAKFENDDKPDWWRIELQGFQRPRWFAQGSLRTCIQYLIAKRTHSNEVDELWEQLSLQNGLRQKSSSFSASKSLWKDYLSRFGSRLRRLTTILIAGRLHEVRQVASAIVRSRVAPVFVKPATSLLLVPFLLLRVAGWPLKQWINRQSKNIYPAVHQVLASWKREFPDRSDALGLDDVIPYIGVLPDWASLMKFYDIIIGYSTDPLYPMLINKPYFAFEHGTIRDIPYTKSSIGRLCSMSYRKAEHVFVTNFDCVESAKNLAHERFSVINHPYDEDHGLSLSDISVARKSLLGELDSTFLVFHPTRHDWIPHTGYADKANDILIRAFIDLRRRGFKLGLVCCEWGSNVKDSKTLLRDFDLDKFVKWLPPLPITPFEQMCRTTDLVADQFKLGAFGGVCFKAMAVGAPILTYLNETLLLRQYPEVPPVINCSTTEGISSRLEEYMSRPYKLQSIGSASRQWMKNYHGKSATVNTQIDQFRRASPEGFAR